MSIIIRQEEERDYRRVEEIAREAFWNDYRMMSFKQVAHKYFAYKATRRLKCWVHRAMFQFGLRKDP